MKVEVVTPEDYMGDIIGDLNSRRGNVQDMDQRGNARVVNAMVPLANMFGYVNELRSMSRAGRNLRCILIIMQQVPQAVLKRSRQTGLRSGENEDGQGESLSVRSRTATSARLVTLTMARRR